MAKYLLAGSYRVEGVQGLLKEGGSSRRAHIEQLVQGLGGTVEAFYFAYGDYDVYVIVDLPDSVTAIAASLAVNASGSVALKTTVLITPEEMDSAAQQTINYRPPGQ